MYLPGPRSFGTFASLLCVENSKSNNCENGEQFEIHYGFAWYFLLRVDWREIIVRMNSIVFVPLFILNLFTQGSDHMTFHHPDKIIVIVLIDTWYLLSNIHTIWLYSILKISIWNVRFEYQLFIVQRKNPHAVF